MLVLLERVPPPPPPPLLSVGKKKNRRVSNFVGGNRVSEIHEMNDSLSRRQLGSRMLRWLQPEYSIDRNAASNLQLVNMSRANLNATGFVTRDESMYGNRRFSNLLQEIRAKLSHVDRFPSSSFFLFLSYQLVPCSVELSRDNFSAPPSAVRTVRGTSS